MKTNLTISDIAKLANVSKATVSFVLNNKEGVSEKTRQRVLSVIEQVDYKPTMNSRRLSYQKSFTIAVVFDKMTAALNNLFYFDIMNSLLKRCSFYNYALVHYEFELVDGQISLPENILNKDVDGLIFLKDIPLELIAKLTQLDIPFVVADDHSEHRSLHTVKVDYRLAAYTAVQYLISKGHRHIGFIGNMNLPAFYTQVFSGYQKALREANLPLEPSWCYEKIQDRPSTEKYISRLLQTDKLPTAFFCMEDLLAIELIRYLQKCELKVPDDISVISIDDIILSNMIYPSLTTVSLNKEKIGESAVDILMALIQNREAPNVIITSNEIIVRESVKDLNLL
ncbi:MAG: LacI family DNA-binding transcriptional regulator [Lachnospiraceae bacterium]|nr:LacI family DNA-binding transcriptional regulator [Lachnospiraceae bacterium]